MVPTDTSHASGGSLPAAQHCNGMPAGAPDAPAASLSTLREIADQLIGQVPGAVRKVVLRVSDFSVEVEWAEPTAIMPQAFAAASAPSPAAPSHQVAQAGGTASPTTGTEAIRAPLVGTFYRAPSPGAAPFVQPGDPIEAGAAVGIIEAMKMMNTITAHCSGTVVAVLPEDGQPVEFDQELVLIALETDDVG